MTARCGHALFSSWLLLAVACHSAPETDYIRLERTLQKAIASGESEVEGVRLNGFNHKTELAFADVRVIVISRLHASEFLLFAENGDLLDRHIAGEVLGVHLCRSEVAEPYFVTEELDLAGTGVVESRFHVYAVADRVVAEVWSGVSRAEYPPAALYDGQPPPEEWGWVSCFEGFQYAVRTQDADGHAFEVSKYEVGTEGAALAEFDDWLLIPAASRDAGD